MLLAMLIFFFPFVFLLMGLLALGVLVRMLTYSKDDNEIESSPGGLVLITGCDSGIGLELAKYVYTSTNYTVLCGVLSIDSSNKGYKELMKYSSDDERMILCKLDITSGDDVENLKLTIEELKCNKKVDRIACLVNNAGIMVYGEFDWLTWNQIDRMIDVNIKGTLRITKMLYSDIIKSKGRIINISSVSDATFFPGISVYSGTKSFVSMISRALGYEMEKFGNFVVTLRLGDFARLTNILSCHARHQNEMWTDMDEDKRALYGEYFHQFNEFLVANSGLTSPRSFQESSLFTDFRRALMSRQPPQLITCAPLRFRLFYAIIECLPIWIQYRMLDLLFQFGFKWKGKFQEAKEETKGVIKREISSLIR